MNPQDDAAAALLVQVLRIPTSIAGALVGAGITSVEEVAYIPLDEWLQIEGVERWLLLDIRERARQLLLEI